MNKPTSAKNAVVKAAEVLPVPCRRHTALRARGIRNRSINPRGMDLMRHLDVGAQLGLITCPTLVSVGELDPVTPVAASQEIVDALGPGIARLEVLAGAGHFAWLDRPEEYWSLLSDFILD